MSEQSMLMNSYLSGIYIYIYKNIRETGRSTVIIISEKRHQKYRKKRKIQKNFEKNIHEF